LQRLRQPRYEGTGEARGRAEIYKKFRDKEDDVIKVRSAQDRRNGLEGP